MTIGYEPGDIRDTWIIVTHQGLPLDLRTTLNIWAVETDDTNPEPRTGLPATRLLVTIGDDVTPRWASIDTSWYWETDTDLQGRLIANPPRQYIPADPNANSLEIMAAAYRARAEAS